MVKPRIPKDNDFIHQYGGAVNQYGTVSSGSISDQNAEDFQRHMQIQETQNNTVPKVSPHDLMSGQLDPNMNADHPSLQTPAPENFGPPKIGNVDTDTTTNFGPPGSKSFTDVQNQLGAPKPGDPSSGGQPPMPAKQTDLATNRQQQMQAQVQNSQHASQAASKPPALGASNPQGGNLQGSNSGGNSGGGNSGGSSSSDDKSKATYKSVEKQEVDNMLQNAMSHMKFKDPDPSAWN